MIIKRKTITRRGGAAGGVDGGGVKSVAVGDSTYQPDEDGQVSLPNLVQAVKINSTTHAPNSSGTVDLGTVGGGGTVNSVSANGTTYQPDANGDVDVGDMVKLLSFLGTNYSPDSDGKITISTIAGYYASNINGLNLYGTTQRPTDYDPTTQFLAYVMSSSSTSSLRILRKGETNLTSLAYYIEFRVTLRVVSSSTKTARVEGIVDVDAFGVPGGVTWTLGLDSVYNASRPIVIALDGLTDPPEYWTAGDAALRQMGYTPTGYNVKGVARDANALAALALATSGRTLVNGRHRYSFDLTFDDENKTYTETSFVDISREAVGAAWIRLNGSAFYPSPDGKVELSLGADMWVTETPFGLVPWGSSTSLTSQAGNVTAVSFLARPLTCPPSFLYIWRTILAANQQDLTQYAIKIELQPTSNSFNDSTKSETFTADIIVTNKAATTGNANILSFLVVPFFFEFHNMSPKMQISLLHINENGSDDQINIACSNINAWHSLGEINGEIVTSTYTSSTTDPLRSTYASYLANKQNVITADAYITRWSVAVSVINNAVSSINVVKTGTIAL